MAILATDLLQARKGDRLSSVFSPDGTLISASAAPHCGVLKGNDSEPSHKTGDRKNGVRRLRVLTG